MALLQPRSEAAPEAASESRPLAARRLVPAPRPCQGQGLRPSTWKLRGKVRERRQDSWYDLASAGNHLRSLSHRFRARAPWQNSWHGLGGAVEHPRSCLRGCAQSRRGVVPCSWKHHGMAWGLWPDWQPPLAESPDQILVAGGCLRTRLLWRVPHYYQAGRVRWARARQRQPLLDTAGSPRSSARVWGATTPPHPPRHPVPLRPNPPPNPRARVRLALQLSLIHI